MNQKILMIDDSAMLRRIAASVLRAQPARYEVLAATRAIEGFAQACGTGVQLIFADYRIASSGEVDLCQRLLSEPRTAHIPVVLLIGRDQKEPEFNALPANVVDLLRKPFAPDQLAGIVNVICGLSKGEITLAEIRARLRPVRLTGADPVESVVVEKAVESPAIGLIEKATEFMRVDRQETPEINSHVEPFDLSESRRTASLRSAFRPVVEDRCTGVMHFPRRDGPATDVYVEGGRLLVVSTRDARAYSDGAAEVLSSKVSPATLEEAVDEQARTGVPFLLTLGTRGMLSKAAALMLLQRFGKKQFSRLWSLRPKTVEFDFEPLETLPGFALRLEVISEPLEQWFLDSLRQLGPQDVAADARHEGCVGTPAFLGAGSDLLNTLALTDTEEQFAEKVNGRSDLPTIAKSVGITTETAYLLLYRFRCLEIMEYRPSPVPFVTTPRTNLRRVLPLPH